MAGQQILFEQKKQKNGEKIFPSKHVRLRKKFNREFIWCSEIKKDFSLILHSGDFFASFFS